MGSLNGVVKSKCWPLMKHYKEKLTRGTTLNRIGVRSSEPVSPRRCQRGRFRSGAVIVNDAGRR